MKCPSWMSSSDDSPNLSLHWVSLVLRHSSWALSGALGPRSFFRRTYYTIQHVNWEWRLIVIHSLWPPLLWLWTWTHPRGLIPHSPHVTSTTCTLTSSGPQSHQATDLLTIYHCHIYLNPWNCISVALLGVAWPSWGNHSRNLTPVLNR